MLRIIIHAVGKKSGQKEPRNIVKSLANSPVSDNLDCEETHTS